ncbi:MAG TPA: CHAT domain-containing tetratricopeptide repeat protein, partial [Rhodothermales bacterium]|nr:CHAT domain-containing tetratricopeptide repeat protein [Rhodothermales bacterium]
FDGALSAYRGALETGERHSIPPEWSTFNQMGFLESTIGRPGEALQLYRNALERADEVAYDRGKAIVLNNLGTLQRTLGQFDEALAQFESILDLPVMESDPLLRAVTHNNIGLTLVIRPKATETDRIDALEHYRRALNAQKEASNKLTAPDNTRITRGRAGGTLDRSIGRQFAAAIGVSSDNPMTARMITLHNIGDVFRRMGKSDSARVNLELALTIFDEIGGDARSKSATLTILGHVELSSNRPDLSEIRYREALSLLMETEDAGAIATAHQNLAEFFYSVRGDVRRTLAHYDSAATARALVRNSLREDLDRLSFSEQDVGLYAGWALAWLSLQSETGRDEAAFAALAASEKGRARALLDLMHLNAEDDPSSILSAVPSGSMSAQGRALTEAAMAPSTTALSYLVTPDTLIVWLIADGGIHTSRVPVRQDSLAVGVSRLRASMGVDQAGRGAEMLEERGVVSVGAGDAASFEDLRDDLSSILIPNEMRELLPESGDLLIVPHSVLNLIPFAALTLDERGILLGERFAILYAPSLTTLALASSRPTDFRAGIVDHRDALIVGNPTMPEVALSSGVEVQLGPLPGAEREAKWVAEHIGTEWLSGSEATESTVRRRLSGAKLAHLATHGFAFSSQARARDSFVALASDTGNDGLLTVGEVLDSLELSAELIVLSACQTGLGDLKQAEGTVGLQRALLAKGARTALVSLWSVSDEATELLMKRFYEHWLASEPTGAAEALKAAQGDVRLTPGFEHPKFWAAFQLVGGG